MPATLQDLRNALPRVPADRLEFARDLLEKSNRYVLSEKQMFWVNKLVEIANGVTPSQPPVVNVGDLSGIIALFDRARTHLKYPAIVLSVPNAGPVRINVAGDTARVPGSLNVVGNQRMSDSARRPWFGRVHRDGNYEARGNAPEEIAARLREFAADPARVASEHGRLTGRCCFCNTRLKDERSTAVGYGATCAEHYGLPWGN